MAMHRESKSVSRVCHYDSTNKNGQSDDPTIHRPALESGLRRAPGVLCEADVVSRDAHLAPRRGRQVSCYRISWQKMPSYLLPGLLRVLGLVVSGIQSEQV